MHKILIVDDDADLLEMVKIFLSRQGYIISTLTKGKCFFNKVESFRPDIILLDIFLGDADGRNLCYELKLAPASQHIPVILYSAGYVPTYSIENSKANTFVNKPFDIKQLSEKIKSLLGFA
jgi:DNA-binding response OmpR family regulator